MKYEYELTKNENERLADLLAYSILDTPREQEFDALVKLASQICGTHISQINFVDADRQWNKATLPETPEVLPRGGSFCSTTILQDEWMIVEDAAADERFNHYPFVAGEPNVRFYAGVNVKSKRGHNIGTICVLDFVPRNLEPHQLESLKTLAQAVQSRLEVRLKKEELERQATFLENSTDLTFTVDPESHRITRINPKVSTLLGYQPSELIGVSFQQVCSNTNLTRQIGNWEKSESQIFSGEFKINSKWGTPVWLYVKLTNKFDQWYGIARDVTRAKLQEIEIRDALKEKSVLLAEIHHRVKNNLAIISAMLELEVYSTEDPAVQRVLQNSQMRIKTMATVHEQLYESGDFNDVPFAPFLFELFEKINTVYGLEEKQITLCSDIDTCTICVNKAIPMALILNELVTNAAKHAFKNKNKGHIKVQLKQDDGRINVSVTDDGSGLPENFDPELQQTIGFTLVNVLCSQLETKLEHQNKNGAGFYFSLKTQEESEEVRKAS